MYKNRLNWISFKSQLYRVCLEIILVKRKMGHTVRVCIDPCWITQYLSLWAAAVGKASEENSYVTVPAKYEPFAGKSSCCDTHHGGLRSHPGRRLLTEGRAAGQGTCPGRERADTSVTLFWERRWLHFIMLQCPEETRGWSTSSLLLQVSPTLCWAEREPPFPQFYCIPNAGRTSPGSWGRWCFPAEVLCEKNVEKECSHLEWTTLWSM